MDVDEPRLPVPRGTPDPFEDLVAPQHPALLVDEQGRVLGRHQILERVWGATWDGEARLVDVHVQRLRKKVGEDVVETVRGFGYRLAVG